MKKLISKLFNLVKGHQADIILLIGVILISLLSFAIGFIVAKQQEKEPIRIEFRDIPHWKGVGETLRFPRLGTQAFAQGELLLGPRNSRSELGVMLRNCGFIKSELKASA